MALLGCSIVSPGCTNWTRIETMLPQLEHYRGLNKKVNGGGESGRDARPMHPDRWAGAPRE